MSDTFDEITAGLGEFENTDDNDSHINEVLDTVAGKLGVDVEATKAAVEAMSIDMQMNIENYNLVRQSMLPNELLEMLAFSPAFRAIIGIPDDATPDSMNRQEIEIVRVTMQMFYIGLFLARDTEGLPMVANLFTQVAHDLVTHPAIQAGMEFVTRIRAAEKEAKQVLDEHNQSVDSKGPDAA